MSKTILITGATDGIGLVTAKALLQLPQKHHILLHGRNPKKLEKINQELSALGKVTTYIADLSSVDAVKKFAEAILSKHEKLDVLINNAGILNSPNSITKDGLDIRFMVNTLAPYFLTKSLLPLLNHGRVINLSSAAQASVNMKALIDCYEPLSAMDAYSQSKLALTMWSFSLAKTLGNNGPIIVAVNPGSLLASKMVKESFGIAGKDIGIGADILVRAALSDEFMAASGKYFDNDLGEFTDPHPDSLNDEKCDAIVSAIENNFHV
ncbi:MAG: SDR family NAD(P)-dependent oxidoreductase [Endozoicomonas sp. (ex Botrylloides leachii)]|nr:SDR family NAD(P)-dependent oxidoreductase [Endozoicomonas sp. (ex Botrylloides leachii)]